MCRAETAQSDSISYPKRRMSGPAWTRDPPAVPGRYRCRFIDGDPKAFDVEVVEDTFNGGVAVKGKRSRGICLPLAGYERCEWMPLEQPPSH